jgi:pyruvate-ferredoxin/flavodoxin oxidoreductase
MNKEISSGVPRSAEGGWAAMDGSEAVVWMETRIGQAAFAYPITPSTPMGQGFQHAVANGRTNLWGEPLIFLELESEHSSASSCEGFALAGGRAANFTSGQGLVLMKEVLFTISGKRLPAVFHIGARALTSQALNIHAGHDDVMAVADCGWGMLFARNAQEALDLAAIARRAAEDSCTPFMNVQDGFLTTHTLESLRLPDEDALRGYAGNPAGCVANLFNPSQPLMSGTVQNQDAYMKGRAAQRFYYDELAGKLRRAMEDYAAVSGRRYGFVDGYRLEDARFAVVGMGSMMETAMATVDWLRRERGMAVGCLHVTSFRPFPSPELVRALAPLEAFAVIERADNPPAQSNPLAAEIKAAFADAASGAEGYERISRAPAVYSGGAGLGGRDVRPGDFVAAFEHMASAKPSRFFFLGVPHPRALPRAHDPAVQPPSAFAMRGHSIGGYGSVTTNKMLAALASELFGLRVQAYSRYGSEKKGLPTTFFLAMAREPLRLHCELEQVDFSAVLDARGFESGNPLRGLAEGGTLFLQSSAAPDAAWRNLPEGARREAASRKARVYVMDLVSAARETAPARSLQIRMQGAVFMGVFLRVTPFMERFHLDEGSLFDAVERIFRKYFERQGEKTIRANVEAVKRGFRGAAEVPCALVETAREKPEKAVHA